MSMQINPLIGIGQSQTSTSRSADSVKTATSGPETAVGVPYSTRVGSTTYSGDVEQFANEYTGSVSNLFGASAIGSSVQQVEDHLGNLISFFA
jgi:hypothetical protein